MLLLFTQMTGWLLAHVPEPLVRGLAWLLGNMVYYGHAPRRRVMRQSITASFPDRPAKWGKNIARQSCVRIVETALLSLASPFFSEARIRRMMTTTPSLDDAYRKLQQQPRPLVMGTAHFAYWEGLTWLPLLLPAGPKPELLTIYRPLRNQKMDDWLRQTRERFGVKLMSRRSGLHAASHVLRRQGCVALLFDQSAGSHGYLTKFLGRECSTTPLPGLLVENSGADVALIYARRSAFWRFTIEFCVVPCEHTPQAVTLALNHALEERLRNDEVLCASWLWMHQRWRILDRPEERQKLEAKRGGLIE